MKETLKFGLSVVLITGLLFMPIVAIIAVWLLFGLVAGAIGYGIMEQLANGKSEAFSVGFIIALIVFLLGSQEIVEVFKGNDAFHLFGLLLQ